MLFVDFGENTNFVAVFEDTVLSMAIRNKHSLKEMAGRVFVISDLHRISY